jgi:hypothetical protein
MKRLGHAEAHREVLLDTGEPDVFYVGLETLPLINREPPARLPLPP